MARVAQAHANRRREAFLDGMSHVAATVAVVTTDGPAGRAGVTVSAMTSVTADEPALLVCVHHLSPACRAIRDNRVFCVNLLRDDQWVISDTFAGRLKAAGGVKFACADWHAGVSGAPALEGALVAFDCRLEHHLQWGTHFVFIGAVLDVVLNRSGAPLIYANRAYGTPVPLESTPRRGEGEAPDRPSLAVGCFVTLGPSFVPQLIADFMAAQPNAEIRLHEGTQDSLRDGLGSGRLDVALTYDLGLEGRAELEKLAEVPPHVLLPPQHPLAGRERISLAGLVPEPMILLDIPPSRTYFTGLFRDAGLDPWVRYHSPSFEMVRGMVGHGLGYSLLATRPAMDVAYDGKPLIVRPLADEVAPARIVVARPTGATRRPVADAFVDCCRNFFAARRQH